MKATASAATSACCTWISARATPNSSTSNTPTAPSSTCRWRNCRSSRATAAPIRKPCQLHTLGSGQWEKAKKKAAEQVHDTAAELLHLYAQRAAREGHPFEFKQHDLEAFADGFGFEETPDQQTAINAVIEDMKSGKPMDRLVCGDVGFGKTEVAMRAAFVAVADGKQVAILCPTTLLAEQHLPELQRPLRQHGR
jgi:transcription-repair coupling factor (superfamily II helicase)